MKIIEHPDARKALEKVLTKLSIGEGQSVLFNCACLTQFYFTEDIPYAGIRGKKCYINPIKFMAISRNARISLVKHELWHTARGHSIRQINRRDKLWNIACDYVINNAMVRDGDTGLQEFPNICLDLTYPERMSEEEIYEHLLNKYPKEDPELNIEDLVPADSAEQEETAMEEAEILTSIIKSNPSLAGKLPTQVTQIVLQNKATKVDWKKTLSRFVQNSQKFDDIYGFSKPNRAGYYDVIYPRLQRGDPIPDALQVYIDVSGSVSKSLLEQFYFEVSTIQDLYPKLTLKVATFNTDIVETFLFTEWETANFQAGGGTDVNCVMQHISDNRLTNVVVFSDMFTEEVTWSDYTPVKNLLWLIIGNPDYIPEQGHYIHIAEDD